MKAPNKVIKELSEFIEYWGNNTTAISLFVDIANHKDNLKETALWLSIFKNNFDIESVKRKELAIIDFVFNATPLQPERETRYYVLSKDSSGNRLTVRKGLYEPIATNSNGSYTPKYEDGLDHKTAEKAQALYGGTIEEIN